MQRGTKVMVPTLNFLFLTVKRAFSGPTGFLFPQAHRQLRVEGVREVVCAAVSYKTVSPVQLCNVVSALNETAISFRALRVYLGCLELVAIREAADRHRKKLGTPKKSSTRYTVDELVTLTHTSSSGVQRELSVLQRAGLLTFTPSTLTITQTPLSFAQTILPSLGRTRSIFRPIPVPRPFLRFLAQCRSPAVVKTAIAYFLRGLSLDRTTGTINARGTVKLSWIVSVMGISERAARYARATLVNLGWFTRDTSSYQRKLNRDGSYFALNVAWKPTKVVENSPPKTNNLVDKQAKPLQENAPLLDQNCLKNAPPNIRLKTPYGVKNQKPSGAGVSLGLKPPTLGNVQGEDLENFWRTEQLYWQAVDQGLLIHSEASTLLFLGAAIRAKTARSGDRVRIFMGIVQKGLWHHITYPQEERARHALTRFREKNPMVFQIPPEERGNGVNHSCTALLQQLGINLTQLAA